MDLFIFGENQLEIFTGSAVLANNSRHHYTLSTYHIGPTDHDWSWAFGVHFLLQTFLNCIFIEFMALTCDGALVANNVDGPIEQTVGWDLHTIGEKNHISRHDFRSMDLLTFSIP